MAERERGLSCRTEGCVGCDACRGEIVCCEYISNYVLQYQMGRME
jgi:hypothetical protein